MALQEILDRIGTLDSDFEAFSGSGDLPSVQQVNRTQEQLKARFVADYQDFLLSMGWLIVQVKEELWPRPEIHAAGEAWTFQYGIFVFGLGDNVPDDLNVQTITEQLQKFNGVKLIPFLKPIMASDYYCFNRNNSVCLWSYEEQGQVTRQRTDFSQTIIKNINELYENKERMKQRIAHKTRADAERLRRRSEAIRRQ